MKSLQEKHSVLSENKNFHGFSTWFYFPVNWMIYFEHKIYVATSNCCLAAERSTVSWKLHRLMEIQLCTKIFSSLLQPRSARKFWKISARLATAKTSWWMIGKQGRGRTLTRLDATWRVQQMNFYIDWALSDEGVQCLKLFNGFTRVTSSSILLNAVINAIKCDDLSLNLECDKKAKGDFLGDPE